MWRLRYSEALVPSVSTMRSSSCSRKTSRSCRFKACRDPLVRAFQKPMGHLNPRAPVFDRGERVEQSLETVVALTSASRSSPPDQPVALVVDDQAAAVGLLDDQIEHPVTSGSSAPSEKANGMLAASTARTGKLAARARRQARPRAAPTISSRSPELSSRAVYRLAIRATSSRWVAAGARNRSTRAAHGRSCRAARASTPPSSRPARAAARFSGSRRTRSR